MEGYRTPEQLREELRRRYAAKDWQDVKRAVFKRDGKRCQTCGTGKNLRCHHKTYVHLWDELNHLEDMATQCKSCHHPGAYGDFTISEDRQALLWLKAINASARGLYVATRWLLWLTWKIIWWTWVIILFTAIGIFGAFRIAYIVVRYILNPAAMWKQTINLFMKITIATASRVFKF